MFNMTKEDLLSAMEKHANSAPETIDLVPKRERPLDKTSMTYWFPLIEAAGLPVPNTKFVEMTDTGRKMIWDLFDGKGWGDDLLNDPFLKKIAEASCEFGYPCFLRTEMTSHKHSWKNTCYLTKTEDIPSHVAALCEFSECADMFGLAWDTWVVRELLPTIPYGVCPRYNDFPVCKEFRFFVIEGKYQCHHPYWPLAALQDGGWEPEVDEEVAYADLCSISAHELGDLKDLAIRAGLACGGSWSIDFLETERGWFVTDMAEAHKSFHWEGCKYGT